MVEVRNNAVSRQLGTRGFNATQIITVPDWLLLDKDNFKGEVKRDPDPRGDRADRQRTVDHRALLALIDSRGPACAEAA